MTVRPIARAARSAIAAICASVVAFPVMAFPASGPRDSEGAVHPYAAYVTEAAQRFGLPERWIWAVMRAESGGDPRASSRVGAIGLMQIMPMTWAGLTARYGLGNDPWNARANIIAGAGYLRELHDRYGDVTVALAAYNAGPDRVDAWRSRGRPLPTETIAYVARIAPAIGTSSIASPAAVPNPAAPSWRTAGLFIARDGDAPAATGGAASPPPAAASPETPSVQKLRRDDLFIPLSGRGER